MWDHLVRYSGLLSVLKDLRIRQAALDLYLASDLVLVREPVVFLFKPIVLIERHLMGPYALVLVTD